MARVTTQVFYNTRTYRWEVWRIGERLPTSTHASKDHAVMIPLADVRERAEGQVLVYSEKGQPETILEAREYKLATRRLSPSAGAAIRSARARF